MNKTNEKRREDGIEKNRNEFKRNPMLNNKIIIDIKQSVVVGFFFFFK